jgi:hypothetical protein
MSSKKRHAAGKTDKDPFEKLEALRDKFSDPVNPVDTSVFKSEWDTDPIPDLFPPGPMKRTLDVTNPAHSDGYEFTGINPTIFSLSSFKTDFNNRNTPDVVISYLCWKENTLWCLVKALDQKMAGRKLFESLSIYGLDEKEPLVSLPISKKK